MEGRRQDRPPIRHVFISVRGFGIRAEADGQTGLAAWRIIRHRHPRVAWLAGAYALLVAGVAVATVLHLLA